MLKTRIFFHRLLHWEYWPFQIVYIPIYFQWAFYAIRENHIFFFNACNPNIKNGGYLNESKMQIYSQLPLSAYPSTILIKTGMLLELANVEREAAGIRFPCFAKPDMGLRGSAVVKLIDLNGWERYHNQANFDYLLQDLIPYKHEVGVFYVKLPHEKAGRLTGIVGKEFLTVVGNGKDNIETLLRKDMRFAMQISAIKKRDPEVLKVCLPFGEEKVLVPYGNHARGAKFYDYTHWITPELTLAIEEVVSKMPNFNFGRIDLMFESKSELQSGRKFTFVEVNGAGSEPTHIYDPKHGIFYAWRELCRHFSYLYRISRHQHKNGVRYLTFKQGMRELKIHTQRNREIKRF